MDARGHDSPVLLVSHIKRSVRLSSLPSLNFLPLKFSTLCSCAELRSYAAYGDPQALLPKYGEFYELRIICTSANRANSIADEIERQIAKRLLTNFVSSDALAELLYSLSLKCECAQVQTRINKRLAKKIRAPLRELNGFVPGSPQFGYVYIVSSDSRNNHFKIGYSRKNPKSRISSHRKCYKDATLIAYTSMIRHAHRVEQLVHWELDDLRRTGNCTTCGHAHKEWFDISKDVAIKVVSRWAYWICSQPYDPQTGKLKMFWARRAHHCQTSDLRSVTGDASDARTWKEWCESWRADNYYRKELGHAEKFKIHWCRQEDAELEDGSCSDSPMG